MTARRAYTRHGLTAPMARVKLSGLAAVDRRTAAARAMLEFRRELAEDLGGEGSLSTQQRTLVELAARARLMLDHVDAWILAQRSVVNARARSVLPIVRERQVLAEHLARLLGQLGISRVPKPGRSLAEVLRGGSHAPACAPIAGPTTTRPAGPAIVAQASVSAAGDPVERQGPEEAA